MRKRFYCGYILVTVSLQEIVQDPMSPLVQGATLPLVAKFLLHAWVGPPVYPRVRSTQFPAWRRHDIVDDIHTWMSLAVEAVDLLTLPWPEAAKLLERRYYLFAPELMDDHVLSLARARRGFLWRKVASFDAYGRPVVIEATKEVEEERALYASHRREERIQKEED